MALEAALGHANGSRLSGVVAFQGARGCRGINATIDIVSLVWGDCDSVRHDYLSKVPTTNMVTMEATTPS